MLCNGQSSTQSSGRKEVNGANIIVALFSERESNAVHFLKEQEMSRFDAVNFISHGISKNPGKKDTERSSSGEDDQTDENNKSGNDALSAYCVNLNEKSKSGNIDPLIGREFEVDRTIQILCRRTKNNPLYVGDRVLVRQQLRKD